MAAAVDAHKKLLKIRKGLKHKHWLHSILFTKFKEARSKGYCLDFNWLWSKARVTQKEITGDPNATVRKHVVESLLKKYNVTECGLAKDAEKQQSRILNPT